MLVVPVGNDQPTVARRVEELGLGEALEIREATPNVPREAAMRVLSDRECHARLSEFAKRRGMQGATQKRRSSSLNSSIECELRVGAAGGLLPPALS